MPFSFLDCNPSAYFTFDSGAKDISGEHAYAGTEMVNFVGGNAVFSGNGMVNIYRFSMDDFAEGLVIRLKATPSSAGIYINVVERFNLPIKYFSVDLINVEPCVFLIAANFRYILNKGK